MDDADEWHEYACERKQRFTSRASAERARKRIRFDHPHERFTVYPCRNCHGYHIGKDELRRTNRWKGKRVA